MSAIDKLKQALGEDAEKYSSHLSEIQDEITNANKKVTRLTADYEEIKNESIGRRHEIRDTWKPKVETLEDEKKSLEDKIAAFDNSEDKAKIETLTQQNQVLIKQFKVDLIGKIKTIKDHPNFEKAVKRFKLPMTEDGKLNEDKLGEMPDEDVLHNQTEITNLEELGLFDTQKPGGVPPIFSKHNNSLDSLQERLNNAKTPAERDKIASEVRASRM